MCSNYLRAPPYPPAPLPPSRVTGFRVGLPAALQFTLLPAKLKQAGFSTHMVGKGHLGCEPPAPHPRVHHGRLLTLSALLCGTDQTTDHLPIHRGFDTHLGYLEAAEHYEHGLQESCDIPAYANLPNEKAAHGQWPPPNGALASADIRCFRCPFE